MSRDDSPSPTQPAEVVRAPAPPPESPPSPPPTPDTPATPEPGPEPGLAALVADLAIAKIDRRERATLYSADVQVAVRAEWAGSDDLRTPRVRTGETLRGICPDGVADWRIEVERRGVLLRREGVLPPHGALCLMTKTRRPWPQARLEARPLARRVADVRALREWVKDRLGWAMIAVGELHGRFGGDVDRLVVFRPARPVNFEDDDSLRSEVALLVASGTPRGLLPLADYDPDEITTMRVDLQVGGVVDLDGDGVEEVLWLSDDLADDGSGPILQISYFAGGEHRVGDVLRKSYSTVEEFGGSRRR